MADDTGHRPTDAAGSAAGPDARPGWRVPSTAAGSRLVDHVREHLVVVRRRRVGDLITEGAILVDGGRAAPATALRGGELLTLSPDRLARLAADHAATWPSDRPLTLVYEDDLVVVVDKPHGLHVAPTGGHGSDAVTTRLFVHAGASTTRPWGAWRPHPVHRLDRATAGLLLVAKGARTASRLGASMTAGAIARDYLARVHGVPHATTGTIDAPLGPDPADDYRQAVVDGGRPAVTTWEMVDASDGDSSLLRVRLATGRTHQIRAHLAWLGHPIVGDVLYGAPSAPDGTDSQRSATRIELRAVTLSFPHPSSGDVVTVRGDAGSRRPGDHR